MSTQSWYPVLPDLNEDGSFLTFASQGDSGQLRPVLMDASDPKFIQFDVKQQQFSITTAVKLGITSFSGGVTFRGFCLTYEAMMFADKIISVPIGGKIYGTRWGAGLRVVLKITDTNVNANLNFGAIAASTELGLGRVEYEIRGIGINNPEILALLPGPGQFDFANYQKILDAAEQVKSYMASNKNSLVPVPFQVLMNDDIQTDLMTDSQAVLFATRNIAGRNTLRDALSRTANRFSPDIIKAVYDSFHIADENAQPSRSDKQLAEDWLDV